MDSASMLHVMFILLHSLTALQIPLCQGFQHHSWPLHLPSHYYGPRAHPNPLPCPCPCPYPCPCPCPCPHPGPGPGPCPCPGPLCCSRPHPVLHLCPHCQTPCDLCVLVVGGTGRPFGCQYINWELGNDGGPCDCHRLRLD